jgi:hypothetical protein
MLKQLEKAKNGDKISVDILHSELIGKSLFVPPTKKENLNKESLFNTLYEVAQSNNSFLLNGILTLQVNIMERVIGSGKTKLKPSITVDECKKNSRSIIVINNNHKACGFHSIVVSLAKHQMPPKSYEWLCMRRDLNKVS